MIFCVLSSVYIEKYPMLSVRLKDFIFVQFYIVIHSVFFALVWELGAGSPFLTFSSVFVCWYHHSNWNLTMSKIRREKQNIRQPSMFILSCISILNENEQCFFFLLANFKLRIYLRCSRSNGMVEEAEQKMKNMLIMWNALHISWVVCSYRLLFMLLRIQFRRHCVCERIKKMRTKFSNNIDSAKNVANGTDIYTHTHK